MSNTTNAPPPESTDTGQPSPGPATRAAASRLQPSTTTPTQQGSPRTGDAVIGARLRTARETAGLSLADLARRVPYSKSALGFFETGTRTPTPAVIACYERLFGDTAADTVTSLTALGKADVNRRSFLRKAAYSAALSATALALPVEATARIATVTEARVVGAADVDTVRTITDAFLKFDEARGGGMGRTAVAEFLSTDIAALLRSRFATEDVRAHAFSAAAELAYLAGFKAHDAGADGVGQRYFLAALRLAELAQTPGQDSWILRILALQGTDIAQPRFSPDLAEAALSRAAGKLGPDANALLTVAVARTHAETGNKPAALAALRAAESAINPDMTSEQPRWVSMWCPNKATVIDQTAKTFLALGDLTNAERYYTLGTSIWNPATHARVWALTAAETGLLRWKLGNHTDATNLWRPALPILHTVDSARTRKALGKVRATAPELFADTAPGHIPAL
ncbi:helix-turn-helix domain-containing protein [Nocardia amikacinitolerans]|uniref:helix-turn-helix domain-containing protein n=1 Tax=Nocardia amikacinitolerans TaxID=756689 RepID=UPI002646898C|nr:helix-turn-helix transcriptional regulator [Nocardia amikacinitolerans]MCP2289539.1 Helix-turn-helix domain-containing protein [Nocardia amikacinitolerans]